MKKFASLLVLAVLASTTLIAQAPAAAPASTGPTKIGIIAIQDAIMATNEGQRDLKALQTKFEPKQVELQNLNKEITDLQNQLKTQGDKLNPDALASLNKQIEGKQKTLQRSYEDAQADYQTQQNEIVNRIGQKLMETLDKYAKANGYTVILDVSSQQSSVLWAQPSTNVTKAVVDEYNTASGVAAPAGAPAKPTTGAGPAKPATAPAKPATPPVKKP